MSQLLQSIPAVLVLAFVNCEPKNDKATVNTSERSEMIRSIILDEARERGYSGDSVKWDCDSPCSVVMRLYSVVQGKATVVQSSEPTALSKSFEIGYLFRPTAEKARTVSFVFYDHDRPAKGLGSNIRNREKSSYLITEVFPHSFHSMGSVQTSGESIVYCAAKEGVSSDEGSVESSAQKMGFGYIITATLSQTVENDEAKRPTTKADSQ